MAKVISDEILRLKIVVNGDQAQKEVLDLERANNTLAIRLNDLKQKQADLSKQRKKDSDEYRQNVIEINKVSSAISENNREIGKLVKEMDVASLTMTQLRSRAKELQFTLSNMNPNSEEYRTAQAEMQRLNGRMTELRTGTNASALSVRNLADKFNQYSGIIVAAGAALAGIALSIKSVIDLNNKMADAQTSVAKTTGLTNEEVKELTKSFSEFDTRTSRIDLLKISEIGGRLGVPKEQIKDFTREVDKAYVALGDGFAGGVESVANKLGKIKGLFKETKDLNIAVAMNQIGSSLNELGAAGAASEENIADFALRVGALPNALKPTIGEALALGAAFEESGIEAERAGTAYTNLISTAAKDTEKFAKVMKLPNEEVKKLINTNPTEFFLKFSEGLKGMDATDLAKTLDYLKLNDQYVKAIIGSASEDTNRFRKSIDLSNQSLREATSLQKEFDKVNNNAAAIYEKVQKKLLGMFNSEEVAKSLSYITELFGKFIGAVDDSSGNVTVFRNVLVDMFKVFLVGTVTILSYNTAIALTNLTWATAKERLLGLTIVQKVNNFLNQSGAVFQNLYNATLLRAQITYFGLTGATAAQTAAQQRLNLMTKANPWGAVLAIVAAVITAYVLFAEKSDKLADSQRVLNEVTKDAAQSVAKEKAELDSLLATARNENASKEQRINAIKRLNALSPEYLGFLTLENIKTDQATEAVKRYVKALDNKAMAEALQSKKTDIYKKIIDENNKSVKDYDDFTGAAGRNVGYFLNDTFRPGAKLKRDVNLKEFSELSPKQQAIEFEKYMPSVQQAIIDYKENIKGLNTELSEVNKMQEKFLLGNPSTNVGGESAPNVAGNYETEKKEKTKRKTQAEKDADKALNKYIANRERILKSAEDFDQQELELAAKLEDAKAEMMQEGFDKEVKLILAEESKKLADLEKQKKTNGDYAELDSIIAKEKGALKARFQAIKTEWKNQDAQYSQLQILEAQKTNLKLGALNEKAAKDEMKRQEENFQKMIVQIKDEQNRAIAGNTTVEMQRAFLASRGYSNESLDQIRTWEEGKSEIEKYYQQKSLEAQVDYLKRKVAEFNLVVQFNPSLLAPDQLDQIEQYKVKINELLASITALKNGKGNSSDAFSSLSSFGGKADILGLSGEQWSAMFKNTDDFKTNIQKIGAAIEVTQQLFAKYYEFVAANEARQLRQYEVSTDRKKKSLKNQLNTGAINQETYKKLTIEADVELDKKKAELEYNAAKRQKAMAIAQVITSTALGIMNIWATTGINPIAAGILSGVVGALGAFQLATIAAQPLPSIQGAEDGFYPVLREQDGKRFNARKRTAQTGIYSEPTMLVGEAGNNFPELVVSGKTMKRIDPQIQQVYMSEIRRVEGFENGLTPASSNSNNDDMMMAVMALLSKNVEVLTEIKEVGVRAYIEKSAKNGKDILEMQKDYQKLYNTNKY